MSTKNLMYDVVNILPLSLLSILIFGSYADIPQTGRLSFFICTAFTVWILALRNMKKKNRLRSIGIVAVFAVGLFIAVGEESRLTFFGEYFWVIWVLCFCAGATAAGLIMYRSIWLRRAAALGFLSYAFAGVFIDLGVSKRIFALICFVLLIRLAEEIQRKWKKSGCPEMEEHITRVAPFLAALCLIVYLLPASDKPFSWEFAKDLFNKTASYISRIFGYVTDSPDDYGKMGFSEEGGFISGLEGNEEEVLYITVNNSAVNSFRLVGCMSGEFKDCEWVFDTESENCLRMTDTLETVAAVKKYATSSRLDYIRGTELNVQTLFYNTKFVFSPSKIRLDTAKEKSLGASEKNGSIISDKRLGYKDEYSISCYVFNYGNPSLKEFFDNAKPLSESEWKEAASAEGVSGKDGLSFEDYQEYREMVYEEYCHSYDVPDEVTELLDKIKSGSSGRYETAKKLEAFLNKMEYSTDCGALPDDVTDAGSFLDYFLFTSQKGYCMHYSTAFVLMANQMGIPCRHVQGYAARRSSDGTVTVTQNEAHAWPEVYFDNVGWVAFEPTPGYSVPAGWKVSDKMQEDWTKDLDPDIEPKDIAEISEDTEDERTRISPLIFIIPPLAVISFLLLFYAVSRLISAGKYRRMSTDDKFRFTAQQSIRFIGYLGLPLEEGETLAEYSKKIKKAEEQELGEHIGFIPIYETLLYADKKITPEELSSAEKTARTLRRLVKKQRLRNRLMLLFKDR